MKTLDIYRFTIQSVEIKYKSVQGDQRTVIERVQVGKWFLNNHFNRTREIRSWALVLVSQKEPDSRQVGLARDFASKIPDVRTLLSNLEY